MNSKKKALFLITLVFLSVALAACSAPAPAPTATPSPVPTQTPTPAPEFPTGTFIWSGNENVVIHLNKDNTWSGFYYGAEVDKGTYEVKGNLYTQNSEYPNTPQECAAPATYEWSFDGTSLKFKLHGEDKCDIRRESFDEKTFILKEE